MIGEMVEETVTISTQMFARILAMVSMAEESNVLPEGCEWLQRRVCDTLLLQNGWRNSQCNDLMNMVKAELEFLKEHKFVEDGMEERETKLVPECEEAVKKRAAEEAKGIEETIEKLKKAGFVECGPRELKLNINEYDHPQRYTGEDGKDLIDRFEEGLIPEEQTRGFLKGNVLKYLVRYEDKGGMDDLLKANEYLRRLVAFEDGGDSDD